MSGDIGAAFLAIDVGTSMVKAAVAASGGRLIATASANAPYLPADPDAPFNRDFDVEGL